MKVLVTGGEGFIGKHLVNALVKSGYEVHSLDDRCHPSTLPKNKLCKYFYGDIEEIFDLEFFHRHPAHDRYDVIFHLAALSRIQPSFDDPSEFFRVNASGTQKVLDFARMIGNARVVYAGSSSRWHDPEISPYATVKKVGEDLCKMYRTVYGVDAQIARFYNVYGEGELVDDPFAAVIGKWRHQVNTGEPITIVGDGEQRRDFTHVDDIIQGLLRIGLGVLPEDIFEWELGTGHNYSIKEVADMFIERFGCKKVYVPNQKGNYQETLRESDDSLKHLEWLPQDRLRSYIKELK